MNIAIWDNDQNAKDLADLIRKMDGVRTVHILSDAAGTFEYLKEVAPDALLLNADLPGLDAISFAENLSYISKNTAIIFFSAYETFAVEAFRVNALDYLVTPITKKRLSITFERVRSRCALVKSGDGRKITVNVFGKLTVLVGDIPIHWQTAKSSELFIYLLFNNKQSGLDKWHIINDLWGEKNKEDADVNFRSTLYRLNKTLRKYDAGDCLKTLRGAYRLNCANLDVDAFRMDDYARMSYPFDEKVLPGMEKLLLSFDGDILGGNDFDWSYPICANYRFLFNQLSKKLCSQYISQCNYIKADGVINNYLKIDSFDEEIHSLKLKIMKQTGRLHEAERYVEFVSDMFKNELGLEIGKRLSGYLRVDSSEIYDKPREMF